MMIRMLVAVAALAWMALCLTWAAGDETTNCYSFETCSLCIQSASCIWCRKENLTGGVSRCTSINNKEAIDSYCKDEVTNPLSYFEVVWDLPLSPDSSGSQGDLIQIRPQKVMMESRVQRKMSMNLTYRHLKNYPVDLYYLMDNSKSMSDDRAMLSNLGVQLVDSMRNNITDNFRLGFGVFVDKAVLPYVYTLPWSAVSRNCEDCDPPYSYKNALPLTADADAFVKKVNETKSSTNVDFPEGALDALMQAIVCEKEIDWRDQSIHLIVVSTDAGFHIAGDGRLGGITQPHDKACHLDADGSYTHAAILDYPSVGQIREKVDDHSVQLIFAVTENQVPLYARLSELIDRTSYAVLAKDSSNIVKILTEKVGDIINEVSMRYKIPDGSEYMRVEFYSACKDGKLEKRSKCDNLEEGDEVQFQVDVTLLKCPKDEDKFRTSIEIYADGRKQKLLIDFTMQCKCQCEELGDPGYIQDAEQCSTNGIWKCGVCDCNEGYMGKLCECTSNDTTEISDARCKQTNNSAMCNGRGECVCGQCKCNSRPGLEVISGTYCECTNFLGCGTGDTLCSGHGDCQCNKCKCHPGWTRQYCECSTSTDNCKQTLGSDQLCSDSGECVCNNCECTPPYYGKFCDDCPTCQGKCEEYKPCVQCQAFGIGPKSSEECLSDCTAFNVTKVSSFGEKDGQQCTFIDEDDCRYYFMYKRNDDGKVLVWVQEEKECREPVNILLIILPILGAVVLIGLATLIAWRIIVSIHDRREYQKFILSQKDEKWSTGENPIYKAATTSVSNPLFGTKTD